VQILNEDDAMSKSIFNIFVQHKNWNLRHITAYCLYIILQA